MLVGTPTNCNTPLALVVSIKSIVGDVLLLIILTDASDTPIALASKTLINRDPSLDALSRFSGATVAVMLKGINRTQERQLIPSSINL